jgi:hypothetical protein
MKNNNGIYLHACNKSSANIYIPKRHAQQNLQIYRLLVLAFQLSHHQTYSISKAIQKTYTLMWD